MLNRRRADKVLRDRAYEIASDNKYDGYQRGLASMVFFDKKSIKKFSKRKVHSSFRDNIWGVDVADMRLLSRQNKRIKYLLYAIDLFSKYAFVVLLRDKRGASIVEGFNEIVNDSNRRPNTIWVDQGSDFYNKVFKNWLKDEGIDIIRHIMKLNQ